MPLTVEGHQRLREELGLYDPDTVLLDGLAAGDSLRRVIHAPVDLGPPVIVFDGKKTAEDRRVQALQGVLFKLNDSQGE